MDAAEATYSGRARSLSDDNPDMDDEDAVDDNGQELADEASAQGTHVRKRRRSRKGLSKRFECKSEGCGKSYSRAEHLYRHQLNHQAKAIYHCEVPECSRTFVRGDLLKRHMDRHAVKGSQLNRRGSMVSHIGVLGAQNPTSPEMGRMGSEFKHHPAHLPYHSPQDASNTPFSPISNTPAVGYHNGASTSTMDLYPHETIYGQSSSIPTTTHRQSPVHTSRPSIQTNIQSYGVLSPASTQPTYHNQQTDTPMATPFVSQSNVLPFNLPPAQYPNAHQHEPPRETQQSYNAASTPADYNEPAHAQPSELVMLDQMTMVGSGPMFGNDNKSPYVGMPADFYAYLFHTGTGSDGTGSPISQVMHSPHPNYGDIQNNHYSIPMFGDGSIMAVTNILDQNVPEAHISDETSQEIYDFIRERCNDRGHAPVERQRESILDGDRTQPDHMLSKRMMQAYIGSYWYHFSDQIPILHKPTFSPDRTPKLLLLAMMTIGAACLDRTHGPKVTKAGAKLSNFLAQTLRWEIFMNASCRPPAPLWVFQALILLELYEKMYSTRELHERAHIHHATTITLMRRGRSLIGKTVLDSPPNPRDGSRHSSTSGLSANSPDEWWNVWVTNESTKRTAFAAFLVDSIHATMFGHSAVMVAHEMRLPLPCDESLWKATTSAEVGRIESNLMSQGIKPVSFLEGLKKTLSNQEVRTDSFGRTVLMSGLLSVTWHMHQRDLQVNVLGGGVIQALGGRDKWRATLTRAYDTWKANFDSALEQRQNPADPYRYDAAKKSEFNIVFESRTVLHNLAHMAMHADIVDLQMFAHAKRLLGRTIGQQEFSSAQRRIRDNWAPSARARDATFYALSFLSSVLAPDEANASHMGGYHQGQPYGAHDDVLLNRSWVLYFAALVVWCYGFALEGPCPNSPLPSSHQEKLQQMRDYLVKFGSIRDPNELKSMKGINNNTALISVLRDSFENSRWELLHEGSNLLNNCISLNSGSLMM
ncbi:fungal-specific transcription factor domain-containing protein [Stachybotrys elegans]|uniref:Fungal-specific transcription factor domain-containing protein n=1 Tax=Stachybotrys elegans TaxID=80388 RepID=A0A8K0T0L4_9HYPO|nr:fungal-specific transcription factor domain-containing protein [Stachybotrys elegans]